MNKVFAVRWIAWIGCLWFGLNGILPMATVQVYSDQPPTPSPAFDRLAEPTLPANPSQEQLGSYLYYYNCMPCHGDRGQGLTDEWRMVWVEDHRNCWARGCHGGRQEDEGFPIPKVIPAVIAIESSVSVALTNYSTSEELTTYLKDTHPPQQPGRLQDDEYQALAVYLWAANMREESLEASGDADAEKQGGAGVNQTMVWRIGIGILSLVAIAALAFFLQHKKI